MNHDGRGANAVAGDATVPTAGANSIAVVDDRPVRRGQAVYRAAWLVTFAACAGTCAYFMVHVFWVGWPWEHHAILYETFAPNVRTTAESWKFWALIPVYAGIMAVVAGVRLLWTRWHLPVTHRERRWWRIKTIPYASIVYYGVYLWYASSIQAQDLRFTTQGLWYPWGFVPWSRIAHYQWGHSQTYRDEGLNIVYPVLMLKLKPGLLTPSSISWTLWGYTRADVTKLLVRYVPRNGRSVSLQRHRG